MKSFEDFKEDLYHAGGSEEVDQMDRLHGLCYNAGAEEKEKQMLRFARWYIDSVSCNVDRTTEEDFKYWKENIDREETK